MKNRAILFAFMILMSSFGFAESGDFAYNTAMSHGVSLGEKRELLREAAEAGHVEAMYELGNLLSYTHMISSHEEAIDWHFQAASQGHVDAQYAIGRRYYIGNVLKKDIEKAHYWIGKSYAGGHLLSGITLAEIYIKGSVIPQNFLKARQILEEPLISDSNLAHNILSEIYKNGLGVEKNTKKAYFFALLAASSHQVGAVESRDKLQRELSSEDVNHVQQKAASWTRGMPFPEF